jgi:hypothetical protein
VTTDAVSWHVTGGRVILTYWADKRHDPEHVRTDAWDLMPRLTPWHVMYQDLGKPLVRSVQMGHLLPPEMSKAIHWTTTPTGSLTAFVPDGMTPDEMQPRVLPDQVLTWLVSALRIMVTPLADVHRQGLPANVRKALARRPHRFKQKAVTVIEFRRRDVSAEQTIHRDFSHRFLRRGHWRKQWMGSDLHGDRRQVRIWIHPTICGPADKPLILRSHVNAFTR